MLANVLTVLTILANVLTRERGEGGGGGGGGRAVLKKGAGEMDDGATCVNCQCRV